MEINVNKERLANAMHIVQSIISPQSPLPILSNVLIEASNGKLRLITTDLDLGISKSIPVEISKSGAITLSAKRFSQIIRELPEDKVEIIVKKNNVTIIKSGNCMFKLPGIHADEFPSLPKIEEGDKIKIKASLLKELLRMTSFAISTDETRYVLNGLLFIMEDRRLTLVATDGRRLALKNKNIDINKSYSIRAIIPYKTIHQLERMLDEEGNLFINFGQNQILFQKNDTLIISRLIEGEFPDYNHVIPEESENKFHINRDNFLNALRRANILTTSESLGIRLDVSKNNMIISKNTPEIGEIKEKISGTYNGKDLSIGFNPNYLIDVLKNFPEQDLSFELTEPQRPGVIRLGKNYLYLVLPMQLG